MSARDPTDLPQFAAWLEEPDARAIPLLVATGQVIFAASGLERALQLELLRLKLTPGGEQSFRADGSGVFEKTARMTAGALLAELRRRGLATELHDQIEDAIRRRNDLVHRPVEAVDVARALAGQGSVMEPVQRLNKLAVDCGRLGVELFSFVLTQLHRSLGLSVGQLATIATARQMGAGFMTEAQLEVISALGGPNEILALVEEAYPGFLSETERRSHPRDPSDESG